MGEPSMQLIESNVQHNTEDIRDLKKRIGKAEGDINDLKANQQLSQHTMNSVMESVNELKISFKAFDEKLDKEREDQLKQYKSAIWKVAIAIVTAFILIQLGLK